MSSATILNDLLRFNLKLSLFTVRNKYETHHDKRSSGPMQIINAQISLNIYVV